MQAARKMVEKNTHLNERNITVLANFMVKIDEYHFFSMPFHFFPLKFFPFCSFSFYKRSHFVKFMLYVFQMILVKYRKVYKSKSHADWFGVVFLLDALEPMRLKQIP